MGSRPTSSGLTGRDGVEITSQHVELVLMVRHAAQQRTELEQTPPLGPRGVYGAEVHAEDPQPLPGRNHVHEGVAGDPGRTHSHEATGWRLQKPQGLRGRGVPFSHARGVGNPLDVGAIGRLLQQHQVGRAGVDHLGDRAGTAVAAALDVVGEESKHHPPAAGPPSGQAFRLHEQRDVRLAQQVAAEARDDIA